MTRVVIVGEIYNADLSVGGGPIIPGAQPPPGIWEPTDPRPTHPIAGYPWPTPPQGGYPSHPIYYPPYPDQGLPGGQPYPDQGLPGSQPRPDHGLPPFPSHPIAPGGGQPPLGMWGPNDPRPTPPIYIPGQPITPDPGDPTKAHVVVYVPGAGAVKFTVDISELPEQPAPPEGQPKAE